MSKKYVIALYAVYCLNFGVTSTNVLGMTLKGLVGTACKFSWYYLELVLGWHGTLK